MKTLDVKDRPELAPLVKEVNDGRFVLMQEGHAVALVDPLDDDDLEWLAIESSPEFIESIARSRQEFTEGKCISHEDLKKKLGLD